MLDVKHHTYRKWNIKVRDSIMSMSNTDTIHAENKLVKYKYIGLCRVRCRTPCT